MRFVVRRQLDVGQYRVIDVHDDLIAIGAGSRARSVTVQREKGLGDLPQRIRATCAGGRRFVLGSFRGNITRCVRRLVGSRNASTAVSIALRTMAPISGGKRAFKISSPFSS